MAEVLPVAGPIVVRVVVNVVPASKEGTILLLLNDVDESSNF
jgi:hypothetical protein